MHSISMFAVCLFAVYSLLADENEASDCSAPCEFVFVILVEICEKITLFRTVYIVGVFFLCVFTDKLIKVCSLNLDPTIHDSFGL